MARRGLARRTVAVVQLPTAEAWIDLLLRRGAELRKAGVLSIACDGHSAVLAAAEPEEAVGDQTGDQPTDDDESNAWENPAGYPAGRVPTFGDVDGINDLPPIPEFDS